MKEPFPTFKSLSIPHKGGGLHPSAVSGISIAINVLPMGEDRPLKTLREVRREHILRVLEQAKWDLEEASRILRVSPAFLKRELRHYGLRKK